MQQQAILVNTNKQGITTITLNRPEKRNAFDDHIIQTLTTTLQQVAIDPATRIVMLRANGKCFSAGADLAWMQRMAHYSHAENLNDADELYELMQTLNDLPKPTICLVQGPTFGGGIGLVACCDIVLASTSACFCFSEVKIGLIPAVISPFILAKMSTSTLRRYFLTAETFSAAQGVQMGLVHEVITDDHDANALTKRGQALAELILQNGPQAVTAAKQLIHYVNQHFHAKDDLRKKTTQWIADQRVSDEGQHGLNAFLQKRPITWGQHD